MGLLFIRSLVFYLVSLRAKLLLAKREEISKLPLKPTVKQQVKVASMRSHLAKQVKDFLWSSTMFLPSLEEGDLKQFQMDVISTPADEFVELEDPVEYSLDEDICYEDDPEDGFGGSSDLPETAILPSVLKSSCSNWKKLVVQPNCNQFSHNRQSRF